MIVRMSQQIPSISTLTGLAQAQCSMCGRIFSTVGLVQNEAGIWVGMPDQKSISMFRGKVNQATKPIRRVRV